MQRIWIRSIKCTFWQNFKLFSFKILNIPFKSFSCTLSSALNIKWYSSYIFILWGSINITQYIKKKKDIEWSKKKIDDKKEKEENKSFFDSINYRLRSAASSCWLIRQPMVCIRGPNSSKYHLNTQMQILH